MSAHGTTSSAPGGAGVTSPRGCGLVECFGSLNLQEEQRCGTRGIATNEFTFPGGWVFSSLNQAHGSTGVEKSPSPVPAQPGPREETTKQDTNFGSPAGAFFPRGPARCREGIALNCSWFQGFSLLLDWPGPATPAPRPAFLD